MIEFMIESGWLLSVYNTGILRAYGERRFPTAKWNTKSVAPVSGTQNKRPTTHYNAYLHNCETGCQWHARQDARQAVQHGSHRPSKLTEITTLSLQHNGVSLRIHCRGNNFAQSLVSDLLHRKVVTYAGRSAPVT